MECQEESLLEAAEALLLLSSMRQPDRPQASTNRLSAPNPPVSSIRESALPAFLPPWGLRATRSSCAGKSKREREEGLSLSACPVPFCALRSPETPLDLGITSDPSTSGSDLLPSSSEIRRPFKRLRQCDSIIAKVSEIERPPLFAAAGGGPTAQPNKRHGRKKTITELRAEEKFLAEDKERLNKLLESMRIKAEAMFAENRRLLSALASSKRGRGVDCADIGKVTFLLPDLNEPLLDPAVR